MEVPRYLSGMAHPRSLPSAAERPDVGGVGDVRPQVPGARRERNAVETKKRILEAAGAEFAAKGYDGARLGNIARQAGIQQALIHHYFEDKARLFEAVLALGLESMTKGVWDLLEQLGFRGKTERREHVTRDDIRILAEAFIGVLFRFYSHNGVFLAMVGHESRTNREQAHRVLVDNVRPLFEAIVGRIREMSENGNVRRDVDAPNLVLSCIAMASFAFEQKGFVTALWPAADLESESFITTRKAAIVNMVLDHILVG